jgi:Mg2+ and Co2+ transporter CorA
MELESADDVQAASELADRILAAAPKHRAELREVRVLEQTLTRIERLAGALRDVASARAKLATARREVRASLIEIATVVEKLAALLRERAGGAP